MQQGSGERIIVTCSSDGIFWWYVQVRGGYGKKNIYVLFEDLTIRWGRAP